MSSHAECGRRVTEEAALPNNPDVGALSSVPPSLLNDLRSNSPGRLHWSRSTTQEISWQLCVWPAASTWTPRTPKNLVFFVPWRTLHFFRSHTHARSTAPPYLTPLSSSFITIPYLTPASFLPSAQEACFRSVFSRVCVFHPIFLLYSLLAHFLPHPMLPAPPCSL